MPSILLGGANMANVCMNYITIQGDPALISLIAKDYVGYNEKEDVVEFNFGLMCPIPDDIQDDYSWRIEHWGNKWDGSDCYVDIDENTIHLNIDTAWGPCDKWTYRLIELCPGVDIYHEYYESGEGFIGWISHNENEDPEDYEDVFYSYSGDSYNYWLTVFDKEYETFEWLDDHICDLENDEEITEAQSKEVRDMIENDIPLETLITKCLEYDIL